MLRVLFRRPLILPIGEPAVARWVLPLRVLDLAELEVAAARAWPDPADEWPDEPTRDDWPALRRLVDRAAEGPPDWPEPRAVRFAFDTVIGRATLLAAVLRREKVSLDAALALLPAVTPGQWRKVEAIAFGIDPGRATAMRLDATLGVWPETVERWSLAAERLCKIAKDLNRLPWDLREMTLPELDCIANGGKRRDPFAGNYAEDAIERHAEFWDATDPPSGPA
jgi:hypothetical protein